MSEENKNTDVLPEEVEEQKVVKTINPMIILMIFLVLAAVATYLVPAGVFDKVKDAATGKMMVDPKTFHYVAQKPIGFFELFLAIPKGMASSASLIFFILIISGALNVIQSTGAVDIGLKNLIKKLNGHENIFIIVLLFVMGLISAFAACSEEYLAFCPLIYAVCLSMGFDSLIAAFLVLGVSSIGYAGGMTNAYTVGVAQSIAGLPMFSGMTYRFIVWGAFELVTMIYLCWYANRIRKNPEKSLMYKIDQKYRQPIDLSAIPPLTNRHRGVLLTFAVGVGIITYCIATKGFYVTEMGACFIIMTILVGLISGMSPNDVCNNFIDGARGLLWVAFIMGLCKALTNVLTNARVIDTIIYALASQLQGLPHSLSACGMFVVQDLINFVVPSGSGQAAATMPIMIPLGDILGLSRQTNVLCFQIGDALTNLLTPAGAKLMAGIAMCHIPYKTWIKFIMPLMCIWWVLTFILLTVAVQTGY